MKLNSVWLCLTSMLLDLKYFHGARPNDCMPRSTFMSRGDSNGWRLIGFVFHYYEKISLGDCAEECLRRTNCKSLNYNVITMYCELNKESYTTMPANISSDSEFYHSLRSTWETGNLLLGFTLPTCAVNQKVSEKDQTTCIIAECDDPPKRRFAQYTSTLREVSSVVYYSCLPQYGSLGNVTSTCKPDGSWNANSFECWRNCTHPPVVNHGTVKPLWALETQILNYVCDANYEAVGNTRVYCQANGSWTEMNLLCLRICENPPLIPNSSPNASRTLDGRAVSYTCHVDYVGFGNTDVFCQPDSTWSNSTYVCVRECDDPPKRRFAQYTSTRQEVSWVVYYSCLTQYGSLGNVTSTCKPDGSWNANSFECWRNCTHPPVVNHGTVKPLWALETQILNYVCDANYEAVGDTRVYCQANGSWTEMNLLCLRICENPPLIPNSSPNASRTLDGRAVSYTCHVDYVGFGNTDVFCQPDSTWSNSTYVCVRECKNPPTVPNSIPSATKVLHGNSTVYSCNTNYVLWPPDTRSEARCESDGRWTFLANFSCKIECTDPLSLAFGTTNQSSALEGSSVTYVCDTGFDSVAAIKSMCNADGNWTTPSGPCLGVCENPPLVPNSSPNASRTVDGRVVSYTCHANFVGFGNNEVSCKPDGTWSNSTYVCKRKCTSPPSLTFGTANNSYALEGMSVTYMCRPGYISVAAITSTCNANGSWTVPTSSCRRKCTNPPLLTNGTANTSSALEGSSVAYVCDDGYDSVADIMSTCTASGNWTPPSSSCLRECTNPPLLTNGTANTSSALEGSSVAYVCDDGYDSVADIMSTCTTSGNWTPPSSSCLRECTKPPLLTNGTANTRSALEGSSVAYVCDDGYDSVADIMSTCTASGYWTPPSSSCLRECIDPPSPLLNATTAATSALAGQAIVYMCDDGLSSVNVTEMMCLEDGSWSEANFLCE